MSRWIAFWNILLKDMRTYYLKPPNISWGIIFPLAWTGMFFIKSGSGMDRFHPFRDHLHAGSDSDL
jgi:ABC-2 type transport system permease protein